MEEGRDDDGLCQFLLKLHLHPNRGKGVTSHVFDQILIQNQGIDSDIRQDIALLFFLLRFYWQVVADMLTFVEIGALSD